MTPDHRIEKAGKSCWTCKDRRVQCDRTLPTCRNCSRVKQACQGYGIRLSWPKDDDRKRSLVSQVSGSQPSTGAKSLFWLLPTSFYDIEVYSNLTRFSQDGDINSVVLNMPKEFIAADRRHWNPFSLNTAELELLRYFESTAYSSLDGFTAGLDNIRRVLLCLAFSDTTISSRAVLHAILAISSLHRDGLQLQASEHQRVAISALSASAKGGIRTYVTACQHVATGMLLCSFELASGTDTHGNWARLLIGVRNIIKSSDLLNKAEESEVRTLLRWTSYLTMNAKFALYHWRRNLASDEFAEGLGVGDKADSDLLASQVTATLPPNDPPWEESLQPGRLMSPRDYIVYYTNAITECLSSYTRSRKTLSEVRIELGILEARIRNMPLSTTGSEPYSDDPYASMITQLHRLAVLIYISRACEVLFHQTRDLRPLLEQAFAQMQRTKTCKYRLPMFVIGCEARTDEQRRQVLELSHRTLASKDGRGMTCLLRALSLLWNQDDLHADRDLPLDYLNKFTTIMSASPSLPTL